MLELLAVISIIVLLVSMLGLVLANYIQATRVQATRATISKIDAILKDRMNALRKQDFRPAGEQLKRRGAVDSIETGKALALKQRMRASFPQQRADNAVGTANPPRPFELITDSWVASHPEAESAAYLYAIITKGAAFGTPAVGESDFTSSEYTILDGVPVFIDAWGQPLQYYRAPSRLFWQGEFDVDNDGNPDVDWDGNGSLSPSVAERSQMLQARMILAPTVRFSTLGSFVHPLRIDGDDPLNRLYVLLLTGSPPTFSSANWLQFEALYQTPATYSTPLIVSSGPDRAMGLAPFSASPAARRLQLSANGLAEITDNITNLNLQAAGAN